MITARYQSCIEKFLDDDSCAPGTLSSHENKSNLRTGVTDNGKCSTDTNSNSLRIFWHENDFNSVTEN